MQQAISLSELNQLIKSTLEQEMSPVYWVIAEIGELRLAGQGHAYLDLVEKKGNTIQAKIKGNIWAYTYRSIAAKFRSVTGQDLRTGMKILAQISVTFHEVYGLSLTIKDVDPNFTLGERARAKQEVIERLTKEGMMELNKRFELPEVPQRIAVISSQTAAGYGDFVNQLQNNSQGYGFFVQLYPATMQGTEAPNSILSALNKIQKDHLNYDVVVLIRGGGAQLDLDCFDSYELALGLAKASLPILTGIGHERDETICDMVAHTKLKTPTAVASFLISGFQAYEEKLDSKLKALIRVAGTLWNMEDRKLNELQNRLQGSGKFALQKAADSLHFKTKQVKALALQAVSINGYKLDGYQKGIATSWKNNFSEAEKKLMHFEKNLNQLDPSTFLQKGYTRTEIDQKPIHLTHPLAGQELKTYSKSGITTSTITKHTPHGTD